MDDNNDAMATDEVRRRFKLLLWAILVLATTFWIPFGYLGLTSISLKTPFSALLVLVGIPGSLVLVNMALSRR